MDIRHIIILLEYSTTALVLRTIKLSEEDRVLWLFSPDLGPIRAVAKGAAKSSSGYSAKTQVLNYCDFQIAKGRELDTILQAKLIEDFRKLKTNFDFTCLGYFMLEVLNHIAVLNDSYSKPFEIVYAHLKSLESFCAENDATAHKAKPQAEISKPSQYLASMTISFLWAIIDYLGYRPDLDTCSLTNRERKANEIPSYFDFENGSVTSSQAYSHYQEMEPYQNHIKRISAATFKTLKLLEQNSEFACWDLTAEIVNSELGAHSSVVNFQQSKAAKGLSVTNSKQGEDCEDLLATLALLRRHLSHQLDYEFKGWEMLKHPLESP